MLRSFEIQQYATSSLWSGAQPPRRWQPARQAGRAEGRLPQPVSRESYMRVSRTRVSRISEYLCEFIPYILSLSHSDFDTIPHGK